MTTVYVIDTSALMDWWVRSYPPEVFPRIRVQMDQLAESGRLIAPEVVLEELSVVGDDQQVAWLKSRKTIIQKNSVELMTQVQQLVQTHPNLIDPNSPYEEADPFVIALAAITANAVVIAAETYKRLKKKPGKREFMPDVCDAQKIPHDTFLGLIRREGWQF